MPHQKSKQYNSTTFRTPYPAPGLTNDLYNNQIILIGKKEKATDDQTYLKSPAAFFSAKK